MKSKMMDDVSPQSQSYTERLRRSRRRSARARGGHRCFQFSVAPLNRRGGRLGLYVYVMFFLYSFLFKVFSCPKVVERGGGGALLKSFESNKSKA